MPEEYGGSGAGAVDMREAILDAARHLFIAGGYANVPVRRVAAELPGTHGIHVHAVGRCDPPGFESAGPHWNPMSRQHGTLNPQGPHMGDMMNITVAMDGSATVNVMTQGGTLRGVDRLLDADGAAVVIHASADDYRTDPSGNSGARIACGVVQGR